MLRVATGENAAAWRSALESPGCFEAARVLKEDRGSWVRRATLLGRDVVVKCRELSTPGRRLKHAIGIGHGQKHWRGAERLMKVGIATGKPVALLRAVIDGRACEVLVLEFVAGKTLLEVLDEIARGVGPGVREQHEIARAAGSVIARMLIGHAWNRDHKPSNLIVLSRETGCEIAVIDCVGVRRWPWMGCMDDMDALETMAASLLIEPMGCGCPARRSLWVSAWRGIAGFAHARSSSTTNRRRRLKEDRETLELIKFFIEDHGDPRPRVNPLAASQRGSR